MSKYIIRDKEQAEQILKNFEHCTICADCPLHTPEGWRCSHLADQAKRYLHTHKQSK